MQMQRGTTGPQVQGVGVIQSSWPVTARTQCPCIARSGSQSTVTSAFHGPFLTARCSGHDCPHFRDDKQGQKTYKEKKFVIFLLQVALVSNLEPLCFIPLCQLSLVVSNRNIIHMVDQNRVTGFFGGTDAYVNEKSKCGHQIRLDPGPQIMPWGLWVCICQLLRKFQTGSP